MFLNVIPNPAPLPAVRGLGNARMIAIPRGMGQAVSGCPETGFDGQMQNWLGSLQAQPQGDAAVGCGPSGGAPCGSPQEAAQMAALIAQQYCTVATSDEAFGCAADPACANPAASAAPYIAQALKFFQGFPASVWNTEAANAASGNYYGTQPAGPCPPGQFVQVGPGGVSCYGSTANQDLQNAPVNIQTGVPLSSTPPVPVTPPVVVTKTPPPAASSSSSSSSSPTSGSSSSPAPVVNNYYSTANPAPAPAAAAAAPLDLSFLTDSAIGGIPNWILIGGGLLALSLLGGKR